MLIFNLLSKYFLLYTKKSAEVAVRVSIYSYGSICLGHERFLVFTTSGATYHVKRKIISYYDAPWVVKLEDNFLFLAWKSWHMV